ncbi:MAG: YdeI/OmpD-associated family protein [Flavobacteriaceae bacterium]
MERENCSFLSELKFAKKIKKLAGDYVHIILCADDSLFEIPIEIIDCYKNEPKTVLETFLSFTEREQKIYLDWIYNAKTMETKVDRIVQMLNPLLRV